MTKQLKFLLFIALILSGKFGISQDCQAHLKKALEIYKKIGVPKGGNAYHLKAKLTNKLSNKSSQSRSEMEFDIYMGSKQVVYKSDYFDLFKDDKNQFYVIKPQKQIFWQNPENQEFKGKLDQLFSLQDSLMANAIITNCEEKKIDKLHLLIISIDPPKILQKLQAEKITYFIDKSSNKIKSITVDYQPGQPMIQQKIEYLELDLTYPSHKIGPALSHVFQKDKKLQDKYNNFRLIDSRNKK